MTRSEVALLLGMAAARDQRTIGDADVFAWFEDIGDLDLADAREALRRHYRESTDRVMPAHIRQLVRLIHDERRREVPHEVRGLPSVFEDDVTRSVRIREGVALCRDVLTPLLERLEANRTAETGELSESDLIRRRALERARAERKARPYG